MKKHFFKLILYLTALNGSYEFKYTRNRHMTPQSLRGGGIYEGLDEGRIQ